MNAPVDPLFGIVIIGLLLTAAITDILSRKIPNFIPISLLVVFAIAVVIDPNLRNDLPWRTLAGLIAFGIGFMAFAFNVMGGGDVKLFAALAFWHPLSELPILAYTVAIAGAALALLYALATFITQPAKDEAYSRRIRTALQVKIPYGVGIFIGYLAVVYQA